MTELSIPVHTDHVQVDLVRDGGRGADLTEVPAGVGGAHREDP